MRSFFDSKQFKETIEEEKKRKKTLLFLIFYFLVMFMARHTMEC